MTVSPLSGTRSAIDTIESNDPEFREIVENPPRLKGKVLKYSLGRALREFTRDGCLDMAAGLTYRAVFAIFPGLLALVSLLGVIGQAETTTQFMVDLINQMGSKEMAKTLEQPIMQLASSSGAGLGLLIGVLGGIWTASNYVVAFSKSLNTIFEVDEGRPIWSLRAVTYTVTLVIVLLAVLAIALLILSGPVATGLGAVIGLGPQALAVWNIAKWPLLVLIAIFMISTLYYWTPNARQSKYRILSFGAFIALLVIGLATLGFSVYLANFSNYNATYGSIGGVIVFLLWLWIMNAVLLFGAEVDAELERGRQLQSGIDAEDTLKLPVRGFKATLKKEEKYIKDVQEAQDLRHEYNPEKHKDPEAESEKRMWTVLAGGLAVFLGVGLVRKIRGDGPLFDNVDGEDAKS
ncbi:YihY/virulence factor BrkB family protein [Neomicrococcus aestuarii]|nr:YihY/virulence factor BrkB family protein [Neomicrococcus aestuarii]MBB5512272.1 membrane protein [Neomicrococcus aestuarii]